MTTEAASPAVTLFQRVHGKMVMLQRLDAQLAGLIEQRRKVQQEIQQLQGSINEEIDRQLRQADELPAKILSEIADVGRNGGATSSSGNVPTYGGPRLADVERSNDVSMTSSAD